MGAGNHAIYQQYGKDYGGEHTGHNGQKYNYSSMPNFKECCQPINAKLVPGQKVKFHGKNRKFKGAWGVVLDLPKEQGRSRHPVKLSIYDKKNSEHKDVVVWCTKNQLSLPLVYNDSWDAKVNNTRFKRELRKKKQIKRARQQAKLWAK